MATVLDIGCGNNKVPGAIGVDCVELPGVDVVTDANEPLPFDDASVDEVHCYHVLEHLDNAVDLIEEIWRVCRQGGRVHIRVPHYSSCYAWADPTHKRPFALDYFSYFRPGHNCSYYSKALFRVVAKRLKWKLTYPNPPYYTENVRKSTARLWQRPIIHTVQFLADLAPRFCERFWAPFVGGMAEIVWDLEALKGDETAPAAGEA